MDWRSKLKQIEAEKSAEKAATKPAVYTLWFFKIDHQHGYTRMGLMTADSQKAQQALEAIYDKPITNLQRKQP